MTKHTEPHPMAGQTVPFKLKNGDTGDIRVEDYADRVFGQSWTESGGNPTALNYAARAGTFGLPLDDNVVYGKIGAFGHIVHETELLA